MNQILLTCGLFRRPLMVQAPEQLGGDLKKQGECEQSGSKWKGPSFFKCFFRFLQFLLVFACFCLRCDCMHRFRVLLGHLSLLPALPLAHRRFASVLLLCSLETLEILWGGHPSGQKAKSTFGTFRICCKDSDSATFQEFSYLLTLNDFTKLDSWVNASLS